MSKFQLCCFIGSLVGSFNTFAEGIKVDSEDLYRTVQTITVIDWAQTINIVHSSGTYTEANPLIPGGGHPTENDIHKFVFARLIAQHLMYTSVKKENRFNMMLGISIIQGLAILHNQSIGCTPIFKAYQLIPLTIAYTWTF
jgi:hypothetical protein